MINSNNTSLFQPQDMEHTGKILIVDDDEHILSAMKDLIELEGKYHVDTAEDATFLSTLTKETAPDIALLDVKLKESNGLDLISELKTIDPEIVCIMMTAYRDSEYTVQAIRNGADDYLFKPVNSEKLLLDLEKYIEQQSFNRTKQRSNDYSQTIINEALQLTLLLDNNGLILKLNNAAIDFIGIDMQQIIGQPFWQISAFKHSLTDATSQKANHFQNLINSTAKGNINRDLIELSGKNGQKLIMDFSLKPITNHKNEIEMIVAEYHDISDLFGTEARLEKLINFDPLTGLPNHRNFLQHFELILNSAKNNNNIPTVFLIESLKNNYASKRLDHTQKSELLIQISTLLSSLLGPEDLISRFHDNDFIIVLNNTSGQKQIDQFAHKIISTLSNRETILDELEITTNIGVTSYTNKDLDSETLIKNAEAALFKANHKGINCHHVFGEDQIDSIHPNKLSTHDFIKAFTEQSIIVHYQPRFDITTRKLSGIEALLRWEYGNKEIIPAKKFIGVAEESNLINEINDFVINTSIQQLLNWNNDGLSIVPVSINLSSNEFDDEHLTSTIFSILKDTQINPELLDLEFKETILMEDVENNQRILCQLKKMGVMITIDDFGTGYSSLASLRKLPIDNIKIDNSIIKNISSSKNDRAIVNSIISLARYMDIKVIAEGVESEDQLLILKEEGCDEAQGHLFGKPVPYNKFLDEIQLI